MHRAWAIVASLLALILATSSVSAVTTRPVAMMDNFFSPYSKSLVRGDYVRWTNSGVVAHTTTSTGALKWDRMLNPGASWTYYNVINGTARGFFAAGIFPYFCRFHAGMTGRVSAPVTATPTSATRGNRFLLRWATIAAPASYRYQVQKRNPGSTVWILWRTTTAATAYFSTFSNTVRGTYYFRARLQRWNGSAWVSSFYSAARSVSVL
jgi:plastocyanin